MKLFTTVVLISFASSTAIGQIEDSTLILKNGFTSLENALEHPSDVNSLVLDGSTENENLEELERLSNLKRLSLINFTENAALEEVSKLNSLEELTLINDGFEFIPESFVGLKNLKRLDLIGDSNLNLQQAFGVIAEMPSLTQLRLENFESDAISDELVFPQQIQTLSLRNNHLQKIPMGVTKIPRLELLDIGENDISDLTIQSTDLATLRNLRVLFLDHESNLTANGLFPVLNTLPSLEIVHLEEGMIKQVNSEFKERSLKELILDPNLLNTSPTYLPNSRYVVPSTPQTEGSGTIQIPLSK